MTSRELVRRTLEFAQPERIPRQLWLLPWATLHHPERVKQIAGQFPDDIVSAPAFYQQPPRGQGDAYVRGTSMDEWGCVFENLQAGVIGEVKSPLVPTWDRAAAVRIPVERLSVDRSQVDSFCRETECYVLAGACPRPFERLQFIRGTQNLLLDLMDRPPELADLLARMHAFYVAEMELWAQTAVDGLFFMDDWGAQRAMLISPALWRELFKPLYRDYVEIAHRHQKAIFMHSDGYILDILPDLVELGLDAINCQVFCMGVEQLGARFGGRITFWGELDRQQLLPRGTRAEVIAAARQMRAAFYRQGGVIAQCEFGPAADPDNIETYCRAWQNV